MADRLSTIAPKFFPGAVLPGQVIAGNPLVLLGVEIQGGFSVTGDITVRGNIDLMGDPAPGYFINGQPIGGGGAGVPAGAAGEIQFHGGGSPPVFGASPKLFWDAANSRLQIDGDVDATGTFSINGLIFAEPGSVNLRNIEEISANGTGALTITNNTEVTGSINITGAPAPQYLINGVPFAGIPAGSNEQIQFNNNGAFGASANLVWDNASSQLNVGANVGAFSDADVRIAGGSFGRIRLSLGGLGSPLLAFSNSLAPPDAVYRMDVRNDGSFAILGDNSLRMGIDTEGNVFFQHNVGIGTSFDETTRPAFKLELQGDVNILDPGGADGFAYRFNGIPFAQSDANGNVLLNPLGGNVGIATQNPQANLAILGPEPPPAAGGEITITTLQVEANAWNLNPPLQYGDPAMVVLRNAIAGSPVELAIGRKNYAGGGGYWAQVRDSANSPKPLQLQPANGTVIIGNAVPLGTNDGWANLHVFNPNNVLSLNANDGTAIAVFQGNNVSEIAILGQQPAIQARIAQSYWGGPIAAPLLLNPLGGAVGIHTQNPQAALDVAGDIRIVGTAGSPTVLSVDAYGLLNVSSGIIVPQLTTALVTGANLTIGGPGSPNLTIDGLYTNLTSGNSLSITAAYGLAITAPAVTPGGGFFIRNLPVFASNADALAAGLGADGLYTDGAGAVKVVF